MEAENPSIPKLGKERTSSIDLDGLAVNSQCPSQLVLTGWDANSLSISGSVDKRYQRFGIVRDAVSDCANICGDPGSIKTVRRSTSFTRQRFHIPGHCRVVLNAVHAIEAAITLRPAVALLSLGPLDAPNFD
ncbi:hypothetical protein D9V32_13410 [Mycetocola tolaasinivorans]|uniref:Uncharacterized protein n=1 Tax=Mycetocola tolaasinivorans TaxID=76635 RepID=A0A3L7A2U1_9MICO|nr:hypothetical protein D9V32_13410 [Mycetocola tolaasinivorans]